jgi:hypothetical protein
MLIGLFAITTVEMWFSKSPEARAQTNIFCAENLACTVTGIWTFSTAPVFSASPVFSAGIGANAFNGPSPWADVTSPPFGAKCDGVTDDTTAVQAAINSVARFQSGSGSLNGGTVFIPPNKNACLVSTLNLDNTINVTIMGPGFAQGSSGTNTATIKFTGTCVGAACLSSRSAVGLTFIGVQLLFSGATAGPMWDMKHCAAGAGCVGNDANNISCHACTIGGPGVTIGPIINAEQVDFVSFDNWTVFENASVFITGPTNNAEFSDHVVFDKVEFNTYATSAIQNASVDWSCTHCYSNPNSGSTGVPFLSYTGGYNSMQDLSIAFSTIFVANSSSSNAFTAISVPTVTGGFGGLNVISSLISEPAGSTNGIPITIGNGQYLTSQGNTFSSWGTAYAFGTNDTVSIGSNLYSNVSALNSGTPAFGTVQNLAGQTSLYGTLTAGGTVPVLTGTGACATITTQHGGAFAGDAKCTGVTGASTLTITFPTAPNGYVCDVWDETTRANVFEQTSHSPTTCVLTVTSVTANDVFVFKAVAY